MSEKDSLTPAPDLPYIGKPAAQALEIAGVRTLAEAAAFGEKRLLQLHGVGPKAIRLLREAAAAQGVNFGP
ncbi:MAG TPA: DNA-binding protein [Paenibacillus sp.]|nr:DNA-binding protein [Paenibacillus sp.]